MWWLIALAVLLALAALAVWAASAVWVRMIGDRWDAMCADDEPERKRRNAPWRFRL